MHTLALCADPKTAVTEDGESCARGYKASGQSAGVWNIGEEMLHIHARFVNAWAAKPRGKSLSIGLSMTEPLSGLEMDRSEGCGTLCYPRESSLLCHCTI